MTNLKIDSPLSRRIATSFLRFLHSVEPSPGVDSESLEVARECLAEVFKIDLSAPYNQSNCDSLIDIFSSREAIAGCGTDSAGISNGASTSADKNSEVLEALLSLGQDTTREHYSNGKDELFGQFFGALEKIHYFSRMPDGNDAQVQLDRATLVIHNAVEEMQIAGCQTFDQKSLAETFKSQDNSEMQAAFEKRWAAEEKKKAARKATAERKAAARKAAEARSSTQLTAPGEGPYTEARAEGNIIGGMETPGEGTRCLESPPPSEDHVPLVQRKRKAVVPPEAVLISDNEEGVAGSDQVTGSRLPRTDQIPLDQHTGTNPLESSVNIFLEGASATGFKLLRSLRSSAEEAHLQGIGPTQKMFEGSNRVLAGIQMVVSAFEEVAVVAKKEANRARAVNDMYQQLQGELERSRMIYDGAVAELRTRAEVASQKLVVAQVDLDAARAEVAAACSREVLHKDQLSSLESQNQILSEELENQRVKAATTEMEWRASFLQSAEFQLAVEDRAYSFFRTGFDKCQEQFAEAGLIPADMEDFPDFDRAIKSLPKEGEEAQETNTDEPDDSTAVEQENLE